MSHKYISGNNLHQKILEGIEILADNVASTLGPRGRNVILHSKNKNPIITKDGVTVAQFINLDDPVQNTAAQIIKQASEQTANEAGDGTTTSTVLARAIFKHALKYLAAGVPPVELKKGIDKAVESVVNSLERISKSVTSVEDIEHIATISANGDSSVGKLIAMAVDKAGYDGAITIEEGRSMKTTLDIVEGFRFDSGYVANAFINDERKGSVRYTNSLILVTDQKLDSVDDLLPVLEVVARDGRALTIIAEEIEGQALAALIMNTVRGTMKISAIKAPKYGEERRNILKDLALSVGATFISRESGIRLPDVKLEHLGTAKTVEATKTETTIIDGKGDYEEIEKRIETLKVELKQTDDERECLRLQERITRLASGVAIIRVGGVTEIEMIEKKHRIEDALEAVRSAQQEGVVPGGGVALIRASQSMKIKGINQDEQAGINIVLDAVKEPARQMALNAGLSADIALAKIEKQKGSKGLDFASNKVVDMLEEGVIDPAKVTRCALQNAASVASTIITTNYAIVEN